MRKDFVRSSLSVAEVDALHAEIASLKAQPGDALPVDEKCSLSTASLPQSLTSVSKKAGT